MAAARGAGTASRRMSFDRINKCRSDAGVCPCGPARCTSSGTNGGRPGPGKELPGPGGAGDRPGVKGQAPPLRPLGRRRAPRPEAGARGGGREYFPFPAQVRGSNPDLLSTDLETRDARSPCPGCRAHHKWRAIRAIDLQVRAPRAMWADPYRRCVRGARALRR